jgi:PTS system beta-glucosides-specific IIC component
MTDEELAAEILRLAGGPANVSDVELCFTRLRLEIGELDTVDVAGIEALPGVLMAVTQYGQFQIALGSHLRGVHKAMRRLLAPPG